MPDPQLLDSALRLLGRREHARRELKRKLGRKSATAAAVEEVLDYLEERGFQSDERFARDWARSRVRKGWGPIRIRGDLRSRGVAAAVVDRVLAVLEVDGVPVDWAQVARETALRRFDGGARGDRKEAGRRWQFMARRGFPSGLIGEALDAVEAQEAMGAPGSVEGPGALEAQGFVHCPWCGEEVEIVLDPGGAAVQEYIEDCEVCCRPWQLVVRWDGHGHPSVEAGRAD